MSTIWALDNMENKRSLYRGEDCMKKFCISLKKHATNVINFENIKMLPLTKEKLKSHQYAKAYYVCGKRFLKKFAKDKNYRKIRDHCHFAGKYRGAAHSICHLRFNVSNLKLVFHKGSNYDLASKFEGKLKCLGENVEKNKNFLFQ